MVFQDLPREAPQQKEARGQDGLSLGHKKENIVAKLADSSVMVNLCISP